MVDVAALCSAADLPSFVAGEGSPLGVAASPRSGYRDGDEDIDVIGAHGLGGSTAVSRHQA